MSDGPTWPRSAVCFGEPGPARLADTSTFALAWVSAGRANALVGEDGDTALDGLGIDEPHRLGFAGPAEEALADAEDDREHLQPQFVDQVVLDQRAYELEAGRD